MRRDKIIDKITKFLFPPTYINSFLQGKTPFTIKVFAFFISLKKKILLGKRGKFVGLTNKEGLKQYDISYNVFDSHSKKNGITALGRFKNSSDFLNICVESIIPYVDEIVMLVDQNSTDNTDTICQNLAKKYPGKCIYYPYIPEVYPGNHPQYTAYQNDSIHSLSYFYNYCMSKAQYKYAMKFDDDMLCIGDDFGKICDDIRIQGLDCFLDIPQINISRTEEGKLAIANKYLSSGVAGIFGDHGIFPLSEKTYFFNDTGCENLVMPYVIRYVGGIGFLHLKNLKDGGGTKNYSGYGKEYIEQLTKGTNYRDLPKKYAEVLKKRGIE